MRDYDRHDIHARPERFLQTVGGGECGGYAVHHQRESGDGGWEWLVWKSGCGTKGFAVGTGNAQYIDWGVGGAEFDSVRA